MPGGDVEREGEGHAQGEEKAHARKRAAHKG